MGLLLIKDDPTKKEKDLNKSENLFSLELSNNSIAND